MQKATCIERMNKEQDEYRTMTCSEARQWKTLTGVEKRMKGRWWVKEEGWGRRRQ